MTGGPGPRTYALIRIGVTHFFRFAHRFEVEGLEHLPARGPVLLTPNHQTHYDGPLVGCSLPEPLTAMVAGPYFRVPLLGTLLRSLGMIPLDGPTDRRAYRRLLGALEQGRWVAVFPEGQRTQDGRLSRLRPGAARAALTLGVPILPVSILGGFEAWPRHRPLPQPRRRLVVRYHPPILCERAEGRELKARAVEVTSALEKVLRPPIEAWRSEWIASGVEG